jgi:zinc transporter ZupT
MKNKTFKGFQALTILSFVFSLAPKVAQAQLVPCGGSNQPACELCHIFVLFDNIVKFILQSVVPPVAGLMLIIAGIMFFAAAGDSAKTNKAKSIITSVVIGLLIVYGAYLLVSLFFMSIGVSEWAGFLPSGWFIYPCYPSN